MVKAYPSPSRPGVWLVRSERNIATYTVQIAGGQGVCDCQGFRRHGRPCKHVRKVLEMMNENHEVATPVAEPEAAESRALVPITVQPPAVTLPTVDEVGAMKAIAASVIHAKGQAVPATLDTPEKAFAVMLAGWELGLKPMTALRHVYCINGRTEPDAQAMMGIVRASEPTAQFVFHRYDDQAVKVELRRHNRPPITIEYTIGDAKRSGQAGKPGPWQQYTRDMLAWSAVKRACRLGAPDLINSIAGVSVAETFDLEPGGWAEVEPPAPQVEPPGFADVPPAQVAPPLPDNGLTKHGSPAEARELIEREGVGFMTLAKFLGVEPKGNKQIEAGIVAWLKAEKGRTVRDLLEAVQAQAAPQAAGAEAEPPEEEAPPPEEEPQP